MKTGEAYEALSAELESWKQLPIAELRARVGKPPTLTPRMIGSEMFSFEVWAEWSSVKHSTLRIRGVAQGSSSWRLERLEESLTARLQG